MLAIYFPAHVLGVEREREDAKFADAAPWDEKFLSLSLVYIRTLHTRPLQSVSILQGGKLGRVHDWLAFFLLKYSNGRARATH